MTIHNPVCQVLLFSSQAKSTDDDDAMFRFGYLTEYELASVDWSLEQGADSSQCTVTLRGSDSSLVDRLLALKLYNPQPPAQASGSGTSGGVGSQGTAASKLEHESKIIAECIRQGVTSPEQIAYILASAEHESDYFATQTEYASGAAYEGRSDLGNSQSGDGVRFKGRGYVQISGRTNYKKYSDILGRDLIGNPDIVSSDQDVSRFILVHGMRTGTFTGAKVGDYVGNGRADYEGAREVVNGRDDNSKIAGQARTYEQRLKSGDLRQYLSNQTPSPTPLPVSPVPIDSKTPTVVQTQEPPKTDAGGLLLIRVGEFGGLLYEYPYLLSSVDFAVTTKNVPMLTLKGVSPLWTINQYKQTGTKGNLTLKQLASQVAQSGGLSLEFEGEGTYLIHIENNGLTPYQLLLRESRRAGYVMYSEGSGLRMHPIKPTKQDDGTIFIDLPATDIISLQTSSKPGGQTPGSTSGVSGSWGKEPTIKSDTKTGATQQVAAAVPTRDSGMNNQAKTPGGIDTGAVTTGKVDTGSKVITTESAQAEQSRIKDFPTSINLVGSIGYLGIKPCNLVRCPTFTQWSPAISDMQLWVSAVHFTLGPSGFAVGLDLYQPGAAVEVSQAMSGQSGTGSATSINPSVGGWVHPYPGSQMTAPWGEQRGARRHGGQDWAGGNGQIKAAQSGVVTDIQTGCQVGDSSCGGGYGNLVDITSVVNGKRYLHRYAHLTSVGVQLNSQVQAGTVIGVEGNTGASFGNHLHFEIRDPGQMYGFGGTVNPADFGIR